MLKSISQLFISTRSSLDPVFKSYSELFGGRWQEDHMLRLDNALANNDQLFDCIKKILVGSDFAARYLCEKPDDFLSLINFGNINKALTNKQLDQLFDEAVENCHTENDWQKALRCLRNWLQVRLILRDLNRLALTQDMIKEISRIAKFIIQRTLNRTYEQLCLTMGVPSNDQGQRQPLLIVGMGKLGADELNLSSDIDLIFVYPDAGSTHGVEKSVSNQEFFTRLGQNIIRMLDVQTADGQVFRVDMRLRPYGQSGALVSNFDALEIYYYDQGREWERFAMVKASIVASNGDNGYTDTLMTLLNNFTYRAYVDFSAIDALRRLKQMIKSEAKRRKLGDDVKLGQGGIREIEFIAQAFQIIRGGKDTMLQQPSVIDTLVALPAFGCIPQGVEQQLIEAYCFLRNTEHAIQAMQDRQTQRLPTEELPRLRLALAMNFNSWGAFMDELDRHRAIVSVQFNAVITSPDVGAEQSESALDIWSELWLNGDGGELLDHFTRSGVVDVDRALQAIERLRACSAVKAADATSRLRLNQLMPVLFYQWLEQSEFEFAGETLWRLVELLEAVARRSAYLVLLIENPQALGQLIKLSAASPWIATELARHPALLDELLNPQNLYSVPSITELHDDLRQELMRILPEDIEAQMEALRYFRLAHAMNVAACEITETLPLMKVSDYLTEIAEVILQHVLYLAWHQMVERHGYPDGLTMPEPQMLIIGYGKLGGIELGHGSDLDLVFLHNSSAVGQTSGDVEGKRIIENTTFFVRMGQKIIHILNTLTPSGQLYDVDMRLRPSGSSGLLVSRLSGFEKYQFNSAWTWEHQALLRARAIAGSEEIRQEFERVRYDTLVCERDLSTLRQDVADMRQKMRDHLGLSAKEASTGKFHLKQDPGGIVDIEFMVQYMALAWAHRYPALIRYTDNIRILGVIAESGLLETQKVTQLIEAYKAYRSMGHRLALQKRSAVVQGNLFNSEREFVTSLWQELISA